MIAEGRGAPVLLDHRSYSSDAQVGVIVRAWVDKATKQGRALLRFSSSTRGEEIFRDVQDGIRTTVSVGYWILEAKLEETGEDVGDVYRITRWRPFEISFVPCPADPSVGVGRAREGEKGVETVFFKRGKMTGQHNTTGALPGTGDAAAIAAAAEAATPRRVVPGRSRPTPATATADVEGIRAAAGARGGRASPEGYRRDPGDRRPAQPPRRSPTRRSATA
jgi:hypothetical protein